ncbi:hypothetical protein AX16_009353, partial [Volvariella volvacea WC 439]
YGHHPRAGPTLLKETATIDLNELMRRRLEAHEQAKAALKLAAERMKWYYNKEVKNVPFKVGDKVLLSLKDYQDKSKNESLKPQFEGPFKIIERLSPVTFKLDLPPKYHGYHPVFHASKLAPYVNSIIPGQTPTTPKPIVVSDKEEWEVERILQHHQYGKTTQYLVRWKGFGYEHDTWEPEKNLSHAKQALHEYKAQNHKALRTIKNSKNEINTLLQSNFTLLVELAGGKLPLKGLVEATGLDLYANSNAKLASHSHTLIPTGIKIKAPHSTYTCIAPRSGLSLKGIDITAGVVNRDFTGELKVVLVNNSDNTFNISIGDHIAQLICERITMVKVKQVDNIGETE